jgi:hypothetical protein
MANALGGFLARLFAVSADFRANSAMFVHPGVSLTFLSTKATSRYTGIKHRPNDRFV